ncbi:MAG: hypothetical protein SGI96_08980 [Bacteroidota bacterium]|mgnify:CR=1 FL=1|nr:hypothetical protein [Bacteroidota bacterium]
MTLAYSYSESLSVISSLFHNRGYTGTHEIEQPINNIASLKEGELTNFCMLISEKSLAKVWDNEDDEYWASYLKD